MLDKFKQIKQLREIQSMLAQEKIEYEKDGVKVIMNGKMEIQEIKLNPELAIGEQEELIAQCVNQAIKKLQQTLALKMSNMPI